MISGVASMGAREAECPLDSKKNCQNREKEGKIRKKRGESGKNREKEEKLGRKSKNREGSFTLSFLTDRAGYAIDNDSD